MKIIILWSAFIGYCIGGIIALGLDQISSKWGNALIYAAVFVPGVLLVLYTEYVRHPSKKHLPRRKSRLRVVKSSKVANSR